MPVEDLRSELDFLEINVKGLNKPQMEKALINAVLPSVGADTQSDDALTRKEDQQFELAKLRLKAEIASEKKKQRLSVEAEEKKERLAIEAPAVERKDRLDLNAKRLESELQWQHEKFEVDMRLQQRKLTLKEEIAKENKKIEESKVKLQMTLDDKERSRKHDLDRLRVEHGVPLSVPAASNDGFKLDSAIKFVPRFDDSQVDIYLQSFEKAMPLNQFSAF